MHKGALQPSISCAHSCVPSSSLSVPLQLSLASQIIATDPLHMVDDSFGNPGQSHPTIEGSPLVAFTSAHVYDAPDTAAAVWSAVTPRVHAWGKPAFMEV